MEGGRDRSEEDCLPVCRPDRGILGMDVGLVYLESVSHGRHSSLAGRGLLEFFRSGGPPLYGSVFPCDFSFVNALRRLDEQAESTEKPHHRGGPDRRQSSVAGIYAVLRWMSIFGLTNGAEERGNGCKKPSSKKAPLTECREP